MIVVRVVQINATFGYGSTGHIVADIHKMLTENGHDSYVFWATKCTESGRADPHVLRVGNDVDHKLHAVLRRIRNNQGWNSHLCTMRLCKRLKALKPDVVHLHNLHSNYIHFPTLMSFLTEQQIATVVTVHDCWIFTGHCTHFLPQKNCQQWAMGACAQCPMFQSNRVQRQINSRYLEKMYEFSKLNKLGVIGVSDWITDCASKSLLKSAKHVQRIYNWIDTELFQPHDNVQQIREKYGIPKGKALILGVSQSWAELKGLVEFQAISSKLADRAVVVLVGDANGHESTQNLKLIGYTSNANELSELYSAADVFVNPSRMETFGKVTAEAMACGTPVVAYANTGTQELVTPNEGILVEDGSISDLIEGVKQVLSAGKKQYSNSCRKRAAESFSKEKLLSQHLKFYEELILNAK